MLPAVKKHKQRNGPGEPVNKKPTKPVIPKRIIRFYWTKMMRRITQSGR